MAVGNNLRKAPQPDTGSWKNLELDESYCHDNWISPTRQGKGHAIIEEYCND